MLLLNADTISYLCMLRKMSDFILTNWSLATILHKSFSNSFSGERKFHILIQFSQKYVPGGPIANKWASVPAMAWHWADAKPIPETMRTHFTSLYIQYFNQLKLNWYLFDGGCWVPNMCQTTTAWIDVQSTARCHYNAVNFLQNPHNRHPITHPWGLGMGCLLWF